MIIIETISFFYDFARQDEKLLIRELNNANAKFSLINAEQYMLELPITPRSGLAFPRTLSQRRTQLLAQIHEAVGCASINSAQSIIAGNNKAITAVLLSRIGVPTPRSLIALSTLIEPSRFDGLEYPLIVKPAQGSWGRMVSLAKSPQDLEILMRHRQGMDANEVVVQEYVDKPGRDIRVTVVGGEAVAAIYRYSSGNDWRTNTARGGKAVAAEIDTQLEDISVKSVKAIGASYAGVDVVEARDGYKVLEVNVVPEFKNVARVTGVNVAKKIVDLLMWTARRGL